SDELTLHRAFLLRGDLPCQDRGRWGLRSCREDEQCHAHQSRCSQNRRTHCKDMARHFEPSHCLTFSTKRGREPRITFCPPPAKAGFAPERDIAAARAAYHA